MCAKPKIPDVKPAPAPPTISAEEVYGRRKRTDPRLKTGYQSTFKRGPLATPSSPTTPKTTLGE